MTKIVSKIYKEFQVNKKNIKYNKLTQKFKAVAYNSHKTQSKYEKMVNFIFISEKQIKTSIRLLLSLIRLILKIW
jgi:hypothetical protein